MHKLKNLSFWEYTFIEPSEIINRVLDMDQKEQEQLFKIIGPKGKKKSHQGYDNFEKILQTRQEKQELLKKIEQTKKIVG